MNHINFSGPINSLSFGNVAINFLRELRKRDISVSFFPIGQNLDFGAYDKLGDDLRSWITDSFNQRFSTLLPDSPSLKMWHINGSESRIGRKQFLYTFYECDEPTLEERNICAAQDACIFSSKHARDCFGILGAENSHHVPLGFDSDFFETGKSYLKDRVHFGLMGKFEKRKNTVILLQTWAEQYGNNNDYQLSCCITNPFFKPEQMNQVIGQALQGKRYSNINFLPFLKTNSEVNEFLNSIDIDLSGMSGAEGWNLPAFNASCLGKWSIVLDHTGHSDWATEENSILVKPSGEEEIYDGAFFHQGAPFNQGNMHKFEVPDLKKAMTKAISACNDKNTEGIKLKDEFSYSNTMDKILEIMNNGN